ncbi:CHAT domain-containing protein [Actinacidiphila glaucinigra]|uniref:CHAT domain-containing protein n=1 Tax=Actinacidiphila glaucinigra TaxID=235986 RepID=UPI002E3468E0|nr:CHAT domain-containing protein [Actinacidiphila glaucinigra]
MKLFGRSEASRYRGAAEAYKSIQDRFNAVGQDSGRLESVRDDVWDLQRKLSQDLAQGRTSVAGPLFSAARLSFLIEFSTGADWSRATTSGLAFSTACCVIDVSRSQDDEPMPEDLLREMQRMAPTSAYAAHRCGVPLAGVMAAEAITSLSLGDRMVARESTATVTDNGLAALQRQLTGMQRTAAREMRATRSMAKRSPHVGLSLQEAVNQQFLTDLATLTTAEGAHRLAMSPNALASARAALSSGRTLVYIAPAPRSAAALRINSPESEREMCESIELPALDFGSVRTLVEQVRDGYGAAQRGELGKKGLARLIRTALDTVTSAFWDPLLTEWPELRDVPLALAPLAESALLPFYTALVGGAPACSVLDVTMVPSGRALFLAAGWQPQAGRVLVAADPWVDGGGLRSIPRTVPEARAVAAVHGVEPRILREQVLHAPEPPPREGPADGPDLLRTTRGTAQEIPATSETGPAPPDIADRIAEASVVHLACHGELRSDDPLASSLLLGGKLPLASVLRNNLRPGATVVLSACELGSITGDLPDEQLGFPAALLAVGARSVIGALWPVPDTEATVTLMTKTHRALAASSATRALGRAIGEAHARGVPPSAWASFACFGA